MAADVYAPSAGYEMWGAGGLLNRNGNNLGRAPGSTNFLVWWDADPLRELLDGQNSGNGEPRIDKYGLSSDTRLLTMTGARTNNGTKATPSLSADVLGDWREEVVVRASDNLSLRIYTTTTPATSRLYTLMHDPQYREAIAWQNVAYNQPPHPSFFLGNGMAAPPIPQIYTVQFVPGLPGDYNDDNLVDLADYTVWRDTLDSTTDLRADGDHSGTVDKPDYTVWKQNFGAVGGGGSGGGVGASPFVSLGGTPAAEPLVAETDARQVNASAIPPLSTSPPKLTSPFVPAGRPRPASATRSADLLFELLDRAPRINRFNTPAIDRPDVDDGADRASGSLDVWDAAFAEPKAFKLRF